MALHLYCTCTIYFVCITHNQRRTLTQTSFLGTRGDYLKYFLSNPFQILIQCPSMLNCIHTTPLYHCLLLSSSGESVIVSQHILYEMSIQCGLQAGCLSLSAKLFKCLVIIKTCTFLLSGKRSKLPNCSVSCACPCDSPGGVHGSKYNLQLLT